MEIHQLRYFLAIVNTGSFTAAAEFSHVSQPSLSSQIAKLENEAGGALLERSRHGSRLTARGQILYPRAREVLHQLEIIKKEFEAMDGLQVGLVNFGCLPTTGAFLLPPLLKSFRLAYPDLNIQLREESSPRLSETLRGGEVDLALLDDAGLGAGLVAFPLFSEPLLIAVPPDHNFANRGAIAIEELIGEPLIIMKSGHGFRKIVLDYLENKGISPRIVYESAGIETVQALVEAGLGMSLVPRMVCKKPGPTYLNILPPTPTRTLYLAKRSGAVPSPAALTMEIFVKEWFSSGSFGGRPY